MDCSPESVGQKEREKKKGETERERGKAAETDQSRADLKRLKKKDEASIADSHGFARRGMRRH